MCAAILETRKDAIACEHANLEALGYSGNAEFLRCRACRQFLVHQGGRVWFLRHPEGPQRLLSMIR